VLSTEAGGEPDLRDYLSILRRRKAVVAASIAVVLAVALGLSYLQTPMYAATAKLLLKPRVTQSVFGSDAQANGVDPARSIQTEIEVIRTEPVQDLVRMKIGSAPGVQVQEVGQTDLVTIQGKSTDARQAALVANAYATAYIDYRRQQAIDDLAAGSESVQKKIADLQKQIEDLGTQIDAAPVCVDTKTTSAACSQRTNIEQSLGQRRTTLLSQQGLFKQRLDQLQVDSALANGGAQVVTPASAPASPFQPTPRRNALLGVVLGMLFGIGIAFLVEYLDDSVKSREDLARAAPGLSVLGLIPRISDWKSTKEVRVVSITEPNSSAAEAYRILRTSIQFIGLDTTLRVIQVTSPSAQEGKTTTLSNLAVAFAAAGLRTVVVDCDLRRPRLHEFFGLPNEVGFTSVLLGTTNLADALQAVPGHDRLKLLASGLLPPNPSELLSSSRTPELLQSLGAQADIVLIDSPPSLPVTDALVLSQQVDATILVTTAGATTRKATARAVEMLHQVGAPLVGAVLNGLQAEGGYGYAYGYRQYLPHPPAGPALPSPQDVPMRKRHRTKRHRSST